MAFPDGWLRKVKITIPDAKISGSNTNFPILLTKDNLPTEMTDAGSNSALNGGGDIRFSEDAAGATQLDLDIVTFVTNASPASVAVELHVKRPTLNTGAARDIYAWYKKVGEVQPAVGASFGRNAVWANSAFSAHMQESSSPIIDSAGNVTFTEIGTPTYSVASQMGDGITVNAAGFSSTDITAFGTITEYRFGFWGDLNATQPFFSPVFRGDSNSLVFQRNQTSADLIIRHGSSIIITGAFDALKGIGLAKIDITWNGTTVSVYVNGVLDSSVGFTDVPTLKSPFILFHESGTIFLDSEKTDQVIFDNLNRSADWLATEFANQNDPATFAIAGTPEAVGGGDVSGTANIIISPVSANALGTQTFAGTSVATLSTISASASGTITNAGNAAITLPPISATSLGAQTFIGSATATISPVTLNAIGEVPGIVGTADIIISPVTASVLGTQTFIATVSALLSSVSVTALGEIPFVGNIVITISAVTANAQGSVPVIAVPAPPPVIPPPGVVDPLLHTQPIVNEEGKPTTYFMRQWLSQSGVNTSVDTTISQLNAFVAQVLTNEFAIAAIQNIDLIAGVGLEGGGDLSGPDRIFDLEDTTVTAGSFTSADITVDAQGRITAAADGSGGGGGSFTYFHAQDQKPSDTDAGTSVAGTTIRDINTVVLNTISGASLALNQITLPAGTYNINAFSPIRRSERSRIHLYNVTDATIEVLGRNTFAANTDSVDRSCPLMGQFIISATKVFEIRHFITSGTPTFGLGISIRDGNVSIYTDVFITKIA